jgi:lysine 6-dehydrogenase
MRVSVLGAGRQGVACAMDLLREEDVRELILIDNAPEKLTDAAGLLTDPRLRVVAADAGNESAIVEAIRGSRVVVSAAPYFLNLGITRAAIRAGVSMVDMGGNTDIVIQQRSLDLEARRAGIRIIPDLGLAPGLGNILAVHAIRDFDRVTSLRIRCGGLPLHPQPPLGYALLFSIHGLLNEYSGESLCLRNGRLTRIPTLTESERIHFPDPVGVCTAVHTSGGISTLPYSLEGKVDTLDYKTVRYPGHWQKIRFLKTLGMFETRPVRVGRLSLPPREIAAALIAPVLGDPKGRDLVVLRVSATGWRGNDRVARSYEIVDIGETYPGLTAMMKLTAYPTAAAALQIAREEIAENGVLLAEHSITPEEVIHHLRSRGIRIASNDTIRRIR